MGVVRSGMSGADPWTGPSPPRSGGGGAGSIGGEEGRSSTPTMGWKGLQRGLPCRKACLAPEKQPVLGLAVAPNGGKGAIPGEGITLQRLLDQNQASPQNGKPPHTPPLGAHTR